MRLLVDSGALRPVAARLLAGERALLEREGVPGELALTGAASVPGAVTRGDVDLHLRVDAEQFAHVLTALRRLHAVDRPNVWSPTLAVFVVDPDVPAGLAVTPRGSEHDRRFVRSWQLIAADPDLLAAHNELKQRTVGTASFEAEKSAFFDRLVALWPEHPAGGGRT